ARGLEPPLGAVGGPPSHLAAPDGRVRQTALAARPASPGRAARRAEATRRRRRPRSTWPGEETVPAPSLEPPDTSLSSTSSPQPRGGEIRHRSCSPLRGGGR